MKICIAIGDVAVSKWIKAHVNTAYTFTRDCTYRQMVLPTLDNDVPDVVLLGEGLPGRDGEKGIAILELCEKIRQGYPRVRIIFVANEHDYESPDDVLMDKIAKLGIYDILCSNPRIGESLKISDAIRMIDTPSDYAYASKYMHKSSSPEEMKSEESSVDVAIVDEVPKKKNRREIRTVQNTMIENISEPVQTVSPKTTIETTPVAQAEVQVYQSSEDTTVLTCNASNCLVFRPATVADFDKTFNYDNLPGPDSFDGDHLRKNILYGNDIVKSRGKIVTFCGAREGIGCSTIALNCAISEAVKGKKVLYVDTSYDKYVYNRLALKSDNWYGLDVIAKVIDNGEPPGNRFITKNIMMASVVENDKARINKMPEKLHFISRGTEKIVNIKNALIRISEYYDEIVVDINISNTLDISADILAVADAVYCISTPDVYEINKLLDVLEKYNKTINIEGKYDVIVNKFVKTALDLNYMKEVLRAKRVFTIKDNFRLHAESAEKWLPVYLITKKKAIKAEYDRVLN